MRKIVLAVCAVLLAMAVSVAAIAEENPAALNAKLESVRGNTTYTYESYPEIWITPYFSEHIMKGLEDYPPHFLRIPLPEDAVMVEFSYDDVYLLNHDTLISYGYYAYSRASFEVFLEDIPEENIIADGSDGPAIYVQPDRRRAHAMIDIKDTFGKTAKLEIAVYDNGGDLSEAALSELISSEAQRVIDALTYVEIDGFWSESVYGSVELCARYEAPRATIDTTDMTLISLKDYKAMFLNLTDDTLYSTEISLETYSYPENQEDATEELLSDGTAYKSYLTDYTGYASFMIGEGKSGPVYLNIKISAEPDVFPAMMEEVYQRVSVTVE